jgi:hypothetical protein
MPSPPGATPKSLNCPGPSLPPSLETVDKCSTGRRMNWRLRKARSRPAPTGLVCGAEPAQAGLAQLVAAVSTAGQDGRSLYGDGVGPVIAKVRDMKVRFPVSQPFRKNTRPEAEVWSAADPGDTNEGYHPSNAAPLPSMPHARVTGNWEFSISCGATQF